MVGSVFFGRGRGCGGCCGGGGEGNDGFGGGGSGGDEGDNDGLVMAMNVLRIGGWKHFGVAAIWIISHYPQF